MYLMMVNSDVNMTKFVRPRSWPRPSQDQTFSSTTAPKHDSL